MSQHLYNTQAEGNNVQVQMGWDTPMSWYYLVISPVLENGELDDPIYSNLYEENPEEKSLEYYIGVCESYRITIPCSMIEAVKSDRASGAMNRLVVHEDE